MAGVGGLRQLCVAGGRFGSAHKAREMVDVSKAVGAGGIVGFGGGIAAIGDFIRLKAIGDAHFIQISIAGEGQKAGVLVLPAETANSGLTRRFDDGNIKHLATNLVVAFLALVL